MTVDMSTVDAGPRGEERRGRSTARQTDEWIRHSTTLFPFPSPDISTCTNTHVTTFKVYTRGPIEVVGSSIAPNDSHLISTATTTRLDYTRHVRRCTPPCVPPPLTVDLHNVHLSVHDGSKAVSPAATAVRIFRPIACRCSQG